MTHNLRTISGPTLAVILHATGAGECVKKPTQKPGWRNRFVCGPGGNGFDECQNAVSLGLMVDEPDAEWASDMHMFRATTEGLAVAKAWIAEQTHGKLWHVTSCPYDETFTELVFAETRAAARASVVAVIMDAYCITWREALACIVSVRKATP